jgi:hypothetical protein
MRAITLIAFVSVTVCAAGSVSAEASVPSCAKVRTEARPNGSGYDHVVAIANKRDAPVACTVSTSVTPDVRWAEIPAGKETEVVTATASNESSFTPTLFCMIDR